MVRPHLCYIAVCQIQNLKVAILRAHLQRLHPHITQWIPTQIQLLQHQQHLPHAVHHATSQIIIRQVQLQEGATWCVRVGNGLQSLISQHHRSQIQELNHLIFAQKAS